MTDRDIRLVQHEPIRSDAQAEPEMKAFLLVVRRALLLVITYIESKYGLEPSKRR